MKRLTLTFVAILICSSVFAEDSPEKLRAAAESGDAQAQFDLGNCYFDSHGVPHDHKEAAKWLLKAAEQGVYEAQLEMGRSYYEGHVGVPQNFKEAVNWLRKAAEQGGFQAQFKLGTCYQKGYGVHQDFGEAYFWFNLAASNCEGYPSYRDLCVFARDEC